MAAAMQDDRFQSIDQFLTNGEPAPSLDYLIEAFRGDRNYPAMLEARLMKKRLELGLPLIQTEDSSTFPPDLRRTYEQAFIDGAREVGQCFLQDGEIERAWPYFRAIGEPEPVAQAIQQVEPGENIEGVIGIAFQEGVHPLKGLELILAQYGMCRAITLFGMQAVSKDREQCLKLLIDALHREVADRLNRAIASQEPDAPKSDNLATLVSGRDWLFGKYDYYVDTSHVLSVLQYAPELTDREGLQKCWELCAYGRCLSAEFQSRGNPPFENPFVDYGLYLGALLGLDVETAIAAFERKAEQSDPYEDGTINAQTLVRLLLRLERFEQALDVSIRYLADARPGDLMCPTAMQICQMAGDYKRLRDLARSRGDLLSYTVASLEIAKTPSHT